MLCTQAKRSLRFANVEGQQLIGMCYAMGKVFRDNGLNAWNILDDFVSSAACLCSVEQFVTNLRKLMRLPQCMCTGALRASSDGASGHSTLQHVPSAS